MEDLVTMHDSIDRVVTLYMCSGVDVLVPVNLAERRMAGIDIGGVVEHGDDANSVRSTWEI